MMQCNPPNTVPFDSQGNMYIYTYTDFMATINYTDSNGNTVDLSTFTAELQVRNNTTDTLIVSFSTTPEMGAGTIFLAKTSPNITLSLSYLVTETLAVPTNQNSLSYSLWYLNSENQRILLMTGFCQILEGWAQ